jgi:hypothetical protein
MKTISWVQLVLTTLFLFVLESCKTYFIPLDSFKEQFDGIDSTSLRTVYAKGPSGDIVEYLANPIEYIKCVDKNNNPYELKNSPSIEIRFIRNNNKRTIFYFDYVFVQDSNVVGDMSRFFNRKRTIPLSDIKKIEVQDGHKNFKYVDKKGK